MLHLNRWTYDFQAFTGIFHTDRTLGVGWAGNLGSAGFKGEATWFTPYGTYSDPSAFVSSISVDYGFRNGLYLLVSGLYNSAATGSVLNLAQLQSETLSAKNLFPFRYTGFVQGTIPASPLLRTSLGFMFSPTGNALIALPDISWSVANNWSVDLVGQLFYADQGASWQALGKSGYLRVKWGF